MKKCNYCGTLNDNTARKCKGCTANDFTYICDNCGSELVQREDDKPETVQKRLTVYHDQTQPLIDYYEKAGILHTADGTKDLEDVFAEIVKILG